MGPGWPLEVIAPMPPARSEPGSKLVRVAKTVAANRTGKRVPFLQTTRNIDKSTPMGANPATAASPNRVSFGRFGAGHEKGELASYDEGFSGSCRAGQTGAGHVKVERTTVIPDRVCLRHIGAGRVN